VGSPQPCEILFIYLFFDLSQLIRITDKGLANQRVKRYLAWLVIGFFVLTSCSIKSDICHVAIVSFHTVAFLGFSQQVVLKVLFNL
jgi:hypothetical protein